MKRRAAGFSLVELVVVILVVGIMSAVAYGRFADNQTFDARTYADQVAGTLRYAKRIAIAQNRNVHVLISNRRVALCFDAGCSSLVLTNANSGASGTRELCLVGGSYASTWACEGAPGAATLTAAPALSSFYFDALGKPFAAGDASGSSVSTFTGLNLTVAAGANSHTVLVEKETGYVY